MLCHALPCHAMPCYAVLCSAMPCHAMPCPAMLCRAVPCCAVLCSALRCHAMPCCAVLCSAMPCCAIMLQAWWCSLALSLQPGFGLMTCWRQYRHMCRSWCLIDRHRLDFSSTASLLFMFLLVCTSVEGFCLPSRTLSQRFACPVALYHRGLLTQLHPCIGCCCLKQQLLHITSLQIQLESQQLCALYT